MNHLPEEITGTHPEIGWPQIGGFRNILVHQYFGVDVDVVRDVVETHLPPLADALRSHFSAERSLCTPTDGVLGAPDCCMYRNVVEFRLGVGFEEG
ncbi:HepT-like ribonuclease domain-containing protein [Rhodococcus artemisiae]|uniref:DUF86 domain-containing protein n=1 Tax=Rhodococcus artemisiae TaxID=714159 RepID=A0ABU7LDD2_9NOCA|nr:HepT-like ribonuclease domain-containing protein [Rhodococcus artemisiae]MEE2059571.1 DUF86 domain-containing protein [Rhodococcus artemisiae]